MCLNEIHDRNDIYNITSNECLTSKRLDNMIVPTLQEAAEISKVKKKPK